MKDLFRLDDPELHYNPQAKEVLKLSNGAGPALYISNPYKKGLDLFKYFRIDKTNDEITTKYVYASQIKPLLDFYNKFNSSFEYKLTLL